MDLSVLQRQLDTINVNRQAKKGILTVIDLKVNSEMKEVILRIDQLEKRHDQRFELIDQRFEAIDRRFEAIDQRFELIDQRFEAINQRFEAVDRQFNQMKEHFSGQFTILKWMVGIIAAMTTTSFAMMATLLLRS
jgi:chromosome segregation ATPase